MQSTRSPRIMAYDNSLRPLGPHGQLSNSWYPTSTHYPGVHLPDSIPSHRSSPQSSNGSLVCTPYQTSGSISEIGSGGFGSTHLVHHDGGLMTQSPPTGITNGLGLVLSEPRKPSPLGGMYPNGLTVSTDYQQEGQNHDISHWHNTSPGYQNGAGPTCNLYAQTPTRSQSQYQHARSYSDNGSTENFSSSTHFSPEGSPFGPQRELPAPINRSYSLPPSMSGDCYTLPVPEPQWNNNQYNYFVPDHHNTGIPTPDDSQYVRDHTAQQWLSAAQPHEEPRGSASPTSNTSEDGTPSLFQARVGSDRTRAISRSRRTNPDKKLFVCPFPECGATITSKHNFKSHMNSHYGIKPHACGQGRCTKCFGTVAEVKRHRASHCQYRNQ